MFETWLHSIMQEVLDSGAHEFCLCPGKRNAPLIQALESCPKIKEYFWYEERSAAFFALGRARNTGRPAAVLTTSGTAAAELLPAAMEAFYTGVPLLLITADRPRRFRGSGAPQSAFQPGLYSVYTEFDRDIEVGEPCQLSSWKRRGPAHLNICFEEPNNALNNPLPEFRVSSRFCQSELSVTSESLREVESYIEKRENLFVIASTLPEEARGAVHDFLVKLGAPVYLEAASGLQGSCELASLRVSDCDLTEGIDGTAFFTFSGSCRSAAKPHLPIDRSSAIAKAISSPRSPPSETSHLTEILPEKVEKADGILRIGGVPTCRLWRDLEEKEGQISVCSISHLPFSGLSWGSVIYTSLKDFFHKLKVPKKFTPRAFFRKDPSPLFAAFPRAEPSLIHGLSKIIPQDGRVYLGNSLPIREWDLAASFKAQSDVWASRGLNGIDGQLSTFLGLLDSQKDNWALIGDLTALYDLAAPWILPAFKEHKVKIVVINNGGGMIFSRLKMGKRFLHRHNLDFSSFAKMWKMDYEKWLSIPEESVSKNQILIELIPDEHETEKFWKEYQNLSAARFLGAS